MIRTRRTAAAAAIVVALVVLLLSHRFGRAEPTGDYRPDLLPDPLAAGCFPLPGDARFTFAYQVRRDGDFLVDGEVRRRLIGQYDEMDAAAALDAIVRDFTAAGFEEAEPSPPYDAVLRRPGAGPQDVVRVTVEELPGVDDDSLVRGTFVLDLPSIRLAEDAPDLCDDPEVTKRWNWVEPTA